MCSIYTTSSSGQLNIEKKYDILANHNLYFKCEGSHMIIYIADNKIDDLRGKLFDLNKIIGYVDFFLDDWGDIHVSILNANIKRKRIGHYLMIIVAYIAVKLNVPEISLDNASGINNYYSDIGCKYDTIGLPEMTCSPQIMLDTFIQLEEKLKTSNNKYFINLNKKRKLSRRD